MTHFVNPAEAGGDLVAHLVDLTGGGADYAFECVGNTTLMRQALECCHKGWGECVIIGVAGAGEEISTRPFQLVTGRSWRGTAFGGARGRRDVPKIVDWYMEGKINIDDLITHVVPLERINEAFETDARGPLDPHRRHLLTGVRNPVAAPICAPELVRRHRAFAGEQAVYRHASACTGTPMEFSIFLPPQVARGLRPVVFYLSGLTCSWANVTEKGGFQRTAAELGLIVVCPDTSPRGADLPGEHEAYDFGSGAGFYVDATVEPWSRHYRMAAYVEDELPALIAAHFPADMDRVGLFGHSMGGHGALTMAMRSPERYRSLSAFAPVVAPSRVPWGQKAFAGYLGSEVAAWRRYDACALAAETRWRGPILIDQGTADEFREVQLRPELFAAACADAGIPVDAPPAGGLRPQLLFYRHVHGRSPPPPCPTSLRSLSGIGWG